MAAHLAGARRHHLAHLLETLTLPAHRHGFALISLLMVGAFAVIPFIGTTFVANVGVTEAQLPVVFIAGGLLTLVSTPLGGMIVEGGAGEPLRHFGTVGIIAAGATLASLWLAARILPPP